LKPGNFLCNTSIETYYISLEKEDLDYTNAIILVSIIGLVVELQRIKKGTLKIATPINRFSDCNNVFRKQFPESGGPLIESRDHKAFKTFFVCFQQALHRLDTLFRKFIIVQYPRSDSTR
jgi:hypothetical protein